MFGDLRKITRRYDFSFCELEVKLEIRSEVRSEVKDKTIAIDPRHFAVPTKALPFSS